MSIMMSPKFDLQNLSRAERVDCIKWVKHLPLNCSLMSEFSNFTGHWEQQLKKEEVSYLRKKSKEELQNKATLRILVKTHLESHFVVLGLIKYNEKTFNLLKRFIWTARQFKILKHPTYTVLWYLKENSSSLLATR